MKLVSIPHPVISQRPRLIEQLSMTIHLIITPISFIVPSLVVVISSKTVSHSITHISDIFPPILCLLSNKLSLWSHLSTRKQRFLLRSSLLRNSQVTQRLKLSPLMNGVVADMRCNFFIQINRLFL